MAASTALHCCCTVTSSKSKPANNLPFGQLAAIPRQSCKIGRSLFSARLRFSGEAPATPSLACHAASLVDDAVRREDNGNEVGSIQNSSVERLFEKPNDVVEPESFTMEAGQLSPVEQGGACAAADVFRCSGCTLPECQASIPFHSS